MNIYVRLYKKEAYFFRDYGGLLPLTLLPKNDRVIEINAMTKTSTRPQPSTRELPVGVRQQKVCAEFLSERLC